MVDVDAARRHVGGHQHIDGVGTRALHHAVALVLRHAAVQRLDLVAAATQAFGERIDLGAGPREDDRQAG